MKQVIEKRLLSIKEAAAYLGMGVYTVREFVWGGFLHIQRNRGGKIYLDRQDLDAWIQNQKRGAQL